MGKALLLRTLPDEVLARVLRLCIDFDFPPAHQQTKTTTLCPACAQTAHIAATCTHFRTLVAQTVKATKRQTPDDYDQKETGNQYHDYHKKLANHWEEKKRLVRNRFLALEESCDCSISFLSQDIAKVKGSCINPLLGISFTDHRFSDRALFALRHIAVRGHFQKLEALCMDNRQLILGTVSPAFSYAAFKCLFSQQCGLPIFGCLQRLSLKGNCLDCSCAKALSGTRRSTGRCS